MGWRCIRSREQTKDGAWTSPTTLKSSRWQTGGCAPACAAKRVTRSCGRRACSFLLRRHSLSARTRARGDRRPARQRQAEQDPGAASTRSTLSPKGRAPAGRPAPTFAPALRQTVARDGSSKKPDRARPTTVRPRELRIAVRAEPTPLSRVSPATSSRKSRTLLVQAGSYVIVEKVKPGARTRPLLSPEEPEGGREGSSSDSSVTGRAARNASA